MMKIRGEINTIRFLSPKQHQFAFARSLEFLRAIALNHFGNSTMRKGYNSVHQRNGHLYSFPDHASGPISTLGFTGMPKHNWIASLSWDKGTEECGTQSTPSHVVIGPKTARAEYSTSDKAQIWFRLV